MFEVVGGLNTLVFARYCSCRLCSPGRVPGGVEGGWGVVSSPVDFTGGATCFVNAGDYRRADPGFEKI